ncbi:MAG: flagellin, partial [Lentisphaeria bacterium]|nr:flagellin [Lentisphaeria bacterium]
MVVKNNMSAVNTLNTLNKNCNALTKSLQKVSSGMKVNSAADDASGYAISEKMRIQIRSLESQEQTIKSISSMLKTAEGAMTTTYELLQTLKENVISTTNNSN